MTYRRKVISLSACLAVLLGIYAAGILLAPVRRQARAETGRLLSAKTAEVASIEIQLSKEGSSAGEKLLLRKDGSAWSCQDGADSLPAQAGRVDAFLAVLSGINRLSLRSDGLSGSGDFGLAEGQGAKLVLKDAKGKVLADLAVGGYGPTGKELYVRPGSGKAIYAVETGFESYLSRPRASWLDLRLLSTPLLADTVQDLRIDSSFPNDASGKAQKPFSWQAIRKDGAWSGKAANLDSIAVESVLRAVQNLSGEDMVARTPVDAFSKILGRIQIGQAQGGPLFVEVGQAAEGQRYYVRSKGSAYVYLVSAYSLGGIFRPESALKKE